MNISKSLMAILLATILTLSSGIGTSTHALETRVGEDTITMPDVVDETEPNTDDITPANEDEVTPASDSDTDDTPQEKATDPTEDPDGEDTDKPTSDANTVPEAFKANYDAAIASIAPYNKSGALLAALNDVVAKIPKYRDLIDVEYGIFQVKGLLRFDSTNNGVYVEWVELNNDNTARTRLINTLATTGDTIDTEKQAELSQKTFLELIDLAKADPRYTASSAGDNNPADDETEPEEVEEENEDLQDPQIKQNNVPTFTELVNQCQKMYDEGKATLFKMLPVVGASPTGINAMDGEALASLATTVDEYAKYGFFAAEGLTIDASHQNDWTLFPSSINAAAALYKARGHQAESTNSLNNAYGRLVAVAKSIDPEFKVDLSGVTRLVPTAPETGSLLSDDTSATVIAVAIGSIAGITALAGIGLTIKRFLFSPLKRRR